MDKKELKKLKDNPFINFIGTQKYPDKEPYTAFIYARTSGLDRLGENVDSTCHLQITQCKEYAEQNEYENMISFYDDGISGKELNRPKFLEMLSYLEEGDAIFIYSLSRLSRSTVCLIQLVEALGSKNIFLFSFTEQIDFKNSFGKMMLGFLSVINQMESELASERIKMVKRNRLSKGILNGKSVFGYQKIRNNFIKEFICVYNLEEQLILNQLFTYAYKNINTNKLFVESFENCAKFMTELKIRDKPWTKKEVLYLMKKELVTRYRYLGKLFVKEEDLNKYIKNLVPYVVPIDKISNYVKNGIYIGGFNDDLESLDIFDKNGTNIKKLCMTGSLVENIEDEIIIALRIEGFAEPNLKLLKEKDFFEKQFLKDFLVNLDFENKKNKKYFYTRKSFKNCLRKKNI